MGQTACAYVPRYELALRARADPTLWEKPAAAVDVAERPPLLRCVTPAAERLGVQAGQIASRARARLPELLCFPPDSTLLAKTEREVLAALGKLAPRLDSDGQGAFFLGLEGLERLVLDLGAFLRAVEAVFAKLRLPARVVVAGSPFVAWTAAQNVQRSSVLAPVQEVDFLERLPLTALALGEATRDFCALMGLRTAGDLRRLPSGALADRLGPEGQRLAKLCGGEGFPRWPTAQKIPKAKEQVELDLELPESGLEPLLAVFQSLLDRLLSAVAAERLAIAELTVLARLDDRSEQVERFIPELPTLHAPAWLSLLRLWLERKPFGAPVARLRLWASRCAPARQEQLSLLNQGEERSRAAFRQAVTRLTAAFGSQAVLTAKLSDTFKPEGRVSWIPAVDAEQKAAKQPERFTGTPPALSLREVQPPEAVEVRGGALVRSGHAPARILRVDGPQRLAGEWWAEGFHRSYYWLLLQSGLLAWVFRDERRGGLFLQAWAD